MLSFYDVLLTYDTVSKLLTFVQTKATSIKTLKIRHEKNNHTGS